MCQPRGSMNLATKYLGLSLQSPFVVGASPCCDDLEFALRLQDAGASAVVVRSLFEEQIEATARVTPKSNGEGIHFGDYADYQLSPGEYLRQIERLKGVLSIPVIASLNGHHPGNWTDFAAKLERAGADAIELNFYQVVTDQTVAADQVETEMLEMVGQVSSAVRIPVAAKLSPYHTA